VDERIILIEEKEQTTLDPNFWNQPDEAEKVMKELKSHRNWVEKFQRVATKVEDLEVLEEFRQAGETTEEEVYKAYARALEAVDELEFQSTLNQPEDELGADITSAGTLYYFRAEALASLSDFSIKIWGAVPRFYRDDYKYNILKYHQGRSIFTAEKARAFRQSKIVLNTLAPAEIGGVNARCFEAAACGAFQLITYNDYVKNYFKPGSEIECFRNLSELREKAEYYLDHEDERKMIANSACRRAHSEHTYERRLQQLLDTVFG